MGFLDFLKKKEIEEITKLKNDLLNYLPIVDIDNELATKKKELEDLIKNKTLELEDLIKNRTNELEDLEKKKGNELDSIIEEKSKSINDLAVRYTNLDINYKNSLEVYSRLRKDVSLYTNKFDLLEYGIYEPIYDFERSDDYREAQGRIIESQKEMIANDRAAKCNSNWTINGSEAKGRASTKKHIKLALRAFNGESNSIIAKVSWNNVSQFKDRIIKSFEVINKLCESYDVEIQNEYLNLKIEELLLEYEFKLKKQEEKEEARRIQEELREEEKAKREIEIAQREAEKEEAESLKSLEKAKKEFEQSTGEKHQHLLEKICQLELDLLAAQEKKERALSMAQQTKRGHVYVISNIGSFGEDVYKIGMTRRLEPLDRIRELGDASVPFKFDVHALVYSENAPALENELHKAFYNKSVNLINFRKEFFRVTLDEIEEQIEKSGLVASLIRMPEAMEYRESIATLQKINNTVDLETIDSQIKKEFPESLI